MSRSIPNEYTQIWESFQRNTKDHVTTLIKEDGVYRHLRFGDKSGSRMWSMDAVTWPGNIATTGDIASGFTFSRIEDMLDFFYSSNRAQKDDGSPWIDMRYWAEKLVSHSQQQSILVYSSGEFMLRVKETLDEHETLGKDAVRIYSEKMELLEAIYETSTFDYKDQLEKYRNGSINYHKLWEPLDIDLDDMIDNHPIFQKFSDAVEYIEMRLEEDPQIRIQEIMQEASENKDTSSNAYEYMANNENIFGCDYWENTFTVYDSAFVYACYALERISRDYVEGNIVRL